MGDEDPRSWSLPLESWILLGGLLAVPQNPWLSPLLKTLWIHPLRIPSIVESILGTLCVLLLSGLLAAIMPSIVRPTILLHVHARLCHKCTPIHSPYKTNTRLVLSKESELGYFTRTRTPEPPHCHVRPFPWICAGLQYTVTEFW